MKLFNSIRTRLALSAFLIVSLSIGIITGIATWKIRETTLSNTRQETQLFLKKNSQERREEPSPPVTLTILIADDNRMNLMVVKKMVKKKELEAMLDRYSNIKGTDKRQQLSSEQSKEPPVS